MLSIKNMRVEERPREKITNLGGNFLSNAELLALVLGKGAKNKGVLELASEIIAMIESDREIHGEKLQRIHGVGPAKAAQILAFIELSKRFIRVYSHSKIKKPEDAVPWFSFLKESQQEEFCMASLDGANQVIRVHIITRGLVNQSQVHPRETFAPAITDRAVQVLLAHNHPSGGLRPSQSDLSATRILVEASKIIGIGILDHLILSPEGVFSIRNEFPQLFSEKIR